ncbi:MAG TPA: hypothetical protein DGQ94_03580 [Pseudomonas sp.]|nr:hypothetical protein [Pseudomonas sp.]
MKRRPCSNSAGIEKAPLGALFCCLCCPLRGHARSHRNCTVIKLCEVPVGAGARESAGTG